MSTKYAIVGGKLIDGTGAEPVENSLVLVDDNGKTKVAMTKGTTYDGYANYLYFLYKDQYTVLEKSSTPHMFSIEPSEGATSATIETTDRFGNHYTTDISW